MRRRRLVGAVLATALVLTGATAGAATTRRVTVTDGTVAVAADVRADDVAAANGTEVVVDLRFSSTDGAVTASSGRVRVHDPDGNVRTYSTGAVDDARQRFRERFTSGATPGTYTVDVISLPLDVTTATGVQRLVMTQDAATTFVVRPESTISLDVAPESVPQGQKVYVHGQLRVADGARTGSWIRPGPGRAQKVTLWFDPTGSAPRSRVTTVTTDDDGYFGKEVTASASGTWSVEYVGTPAWAPTGETSRMSVRSGGAAVRSGVATVTVRGEKLRARVIVPKTVTVGLSPKQVATDVAFLFPHQSGNATWLEVCHTSPRVCSENTPFSDSQIWDDNTVRQVLYLDAASPAGTYRVGLESQGYRTYDENEYAAVRFSSSKTVTTFQLKHATRTGAKASTTRPKKNKTVVLSGKVTEARASAGVKGYYGVKGAKVKVYFDPTGPAKAKLHSTVKTRSGGAYSVRVRASKSGTWVVKYTGSSLRAPSSDSVRVKLR